MYDLGPYQDGPQPTRFTFDLPEGAYSWKICTWNRLGPKNTTLLFNMEIGSSEGKGYLFRKYTWKFRQPCFAQLLNGRYVTGRTVCLRKKRNSRSGWERDPFLAGVSGDAGELATDTAVDTAKEPSSSLWGIISAGGRIRPGGPVDAVCFSHGSHDRFFLSQGSEDKRKSRLHAALYGLFIVLLYTVLIAVIIGITYFSGGPSVTANIFNWLATHWVPNILFFMLFLVFAASFFGAFELVLPSKWTTKTDAKADKGGILGIFFLALTLVLVSFSCTGPIVGAVLDQFNPGSGSVNR